MNTRIASTSEIVTKITGEKYQEVKMDNGDNAVIIRPLNAEHTSYLVGIEEYNG